MKPSVGLDLDGQSDPTPSRSNPNPIRNRHGNFQSTIRSDLVFGALSCRRITTPAVSVGQNVTPDLGNSTGQKAQVVSSTDNYGQALRSIFWDIAWSDPTSDRIGVGWLRRLYFSTNIIWAVTISDDLIPFMSSSYAEASHSNTVKSTLPNSGGTY